MPFTEFYGFSDVDFDGTPFIRLADSGTYEENLVHELMHLKLKLRGFPYGIHWQDRCQLDNRIHKWLSDNLKDAIEHWIFYPDIEAMHLSPDPEIPVDLRAAIKRDSYGAGENLSIENLAVYYFRVLTYPQEPDLTAEVSDWYDRKGWTQAKTIGSQMYNLLLTMRPIKPEDEITVFVTCANILFWNASFFEAGWKTVLRGSVSLRIVNIGMVRWTMCVKPVSMDNAQ